MWLFSKQYKEPCWQDSTAPRGLFFGGKWRRWIWFFKVSSNPSCFVLVRLSSLVSSAFLPWYVFGKSRKTCVSMRVICVSCRSVRGAKTAPLSQRGAKTAPLRNVSGAFGTPPMRVISCRFWLILKTCQDSTLRHPAYNGVKQFTVGDMGKRKAWGLVNTHTNLTFCLEKHFLGKQRANVFGKALDSCGTIVKKIPWVWDWKSCFSGAPSSWMLRGVETAPLKKLNFWNWNGTPLNLLDVYMYIYIMYTHYTYIKHVRCKP